MTTTHIKKTILSGLLLGITLLAGCNSDDNGGTIADDDPVAAEQITRPSLIEVMNYYHAIV